LILIVKYLSIAVVAYLLGAIPFGLIISQRMAHVDIRQHGSGNIGATNVFRTLGTKLGLITALLDLGKAALAVWLGMLIIGNDAFIVAGHDIHAQAAQCMAAIMVMVGHNWSAYIGFKGGKGVACFLGGLLVINWMVALIGVAAGIIVIVVTRYVSLGSMLASLCVLFAMVVLALLAMVVPLYALYGLVAAGLIIYQHRANITRLQAGTELKLGGDHRLKR
jgi:acyl phosphate:glycerol-3-phosphate acyltransferase